MKRHDQRSISIFRFICRYTNQHGFPPTLVEIADSTGFKSNSGVLRHLDKLEKWRWIERYHGQARSIRILHIPQQLNADNDNPSPQPAPPRLSRPTAAKHTADTAPQ